MKIFGSILCPNVAALVLMFLFAGARDQAATPSAAEISTADIHLALSASGPQPHLVWMSGAAGYSLRNREAELLPAEVEVNGATVSLKWIHKPALDEADVRHAIFVFESETPHLRLRWEWQARAAFGPIEHRITVENLGDKEVWLPMIDSLRLDWAVAPGGTLKNFYVEKGAGAPSVQGTHLDDLVDGYHWTGTSSTYAHPHEGAPREIIPAEFVYGSGQSEQGWYAGIEFSGRTRINLDRNGGSVKTVLGLNPDPGPFCTRLAPGGSFDNSDSFPGCIRRRS